MPGGYQKYRIGERIGIRYFKTVKRKVRIMTKFKGFTLAEVLITLGIIGVVAAMTMPTLINSTQGAQYKTAYKKALSVMSQAVVMNIALDDYDLSQTTEGAAATAGTAGSEYTDDTQSLYTLFKNRMNVVKVAATDDFQGDTNGNSDYYKIVSVGDNDKTDYTAFATKHVTASGNAFPVLTTGGKWPTGLTMLFYNDGITFIYDNTQGGCAAATATTNDEYCFGFIDVNGQKAPNRVVACDAGDIDDSGEDNAACVVSNPTDIYPVALYDQSIVPASAAARAVLYAK